MSDNLHAVVIAGGSGTRFWPLSRKARPKQLIPLAGDTSLLAQTFARVESIIESDAQWLVLGAQHETMSRQQVPSVPHGQVLVEPLARNTAAAIGLATVHIAARGENEVMVVLPADHHVRDAQAFCNAVTQAKAIAQQGAIVTLGIEPTHPETGYGYIKRGEALEGGAFKVAQFCEKPDKETAAQFVQSSVYDWNAGIFIMKPAALLAEMQRQLPGLHDGLIRIAEAIGTGAYDEVLANEFEHFESISIDYGIMEHAQNVAVVPVRCGWSDLGSWASLGAVVDADPSGNVMDGAGVLFEASHCIVSAEPGTVAAVIGVRDLVVVHTKDATLVMPRERAQEVRGIVDELKSRGWEDFL